MRHHTKDKGDKGDRGVGFVTADLMVKNNQTKGIYLAENYKMVP